MVEYTREKSRVDVEMVQSYFMQLKEAVSDLQAKNEKKNAIQDRCRMKFCLALKLNIKYE